MFRTILAAAIAMLLLCLLSVDAQDLKKKKPEPDTSAFAGKITDVNVNEETKKVESIFVETRIFNRVAARNARINDQTKIEFVGAKDKGDEVLKVGQTAAVKMDPKTDYAVTIKVTLGPAPKLVVPPKKTDK